MVVPLGIARRGVRGAREGRLARPDDTVGGLSATAVPEFVWAVVVIIVFSLWLRILPVTAQPPPRVGLPHPGRVSDPARALPRVRAVRVHRAHGPRRDDRGARLRLHAHRDLKGLPHRTVVFRHVLRNSLLPTIAVVATQAGYLIGGLVAIELVFNYQGIGQLMYRAAQQKDFPVLESACSIVGIVYLVATLLADIALLAVEPAHPLRGSR